MSGQNLIGLIADTHGLVRPAVHDALAGVELILHAGDVGGADVLAELATIAPIRAVYGNTDPPGTPGLAQEVVYEVGGLTIHVSHGHELGAPTPERLLGRYTGDILVYGHTHVAREFKADGRVVINPGAAGPRRFNLAPSVARLRIENGVPRVEFVPLD